MFKRRLKRAVLSISLIALIWLALFSVATAPSWEKEVAALRQPTGVVHAATYPEGISIPSLSIQAPIIWDIPLDQTDDYLNKGVVQMQGSAYPGEDGNLFLTGHSSDYFWKHDQFATVFAALPVIKDGVEVIVTKDGHSFVYTVQKHWLTQADDMRVTDALPGKNITLITCYPIGTSQKRLVVRGILKAL